MFSFNPVYMRRCLQLASYGIGDTSPNPMVGAVIVYKDKIIGEGYHRRYGEAHAEPNAIASVRDKSLLKDATLYVNLEPCSHHGKTPPCSDLIIQHQIPRVVIACLDPNPKVAGNGVKKLKNANVEVLIGVMEQECRELNKRFFSFFEKKRPYVLLKWAQTADGFIDKKRKSVAEPPLRISNAITFMLAHKLRAENQSILVGTDTAILDNPSLNVRMWTGRNPIRLVVDRKGRIPQAQKLLADNEPTLVYTEQERERRQNLEYIQLPFDSELLNEILNDIYKRNINSVLIEGGSKMLQSFIQQGLWDEAIVEVAPTKIEEGVAAPILTMLPTKQEEYEGHYVYTYKKEQ